MKAFGDVLRSARIKLEMSLQYVSARTTKHHGGDMPIGLPPQSISRFESRECAPSITAVWLLAKALGVEFRCSEHGWSTGPVGEADGLREGLCEALAGYHHDFGHEMASCDECGFGVLIDEDGCCTTCCRDAFAAPASFIVLRPEQLDRLRKLVGMEG